MHYVKQFCINGVNTKQVACIELQGVPNAATEGAVGVLGMDMTSPTHDVYRCVAVNGSVYTWELLSAGMSIINATVTGEGGEAMTFAYSNLRIPDGYIIKRGDLILDSEGYLYQVKSIGVSSCVTAYCGTHIGGIVGGDNDYRLIVEDGKLKLVTESGAVLSSIDYALPDDTTIARNDETGKISALGVNTIEGGVLRFFVGDQDTYLALTPEQRNDLFAIITDMELHADTASRLTVDETFTFEVSAGGTDVTSIIEPDRIHTIAVHHTSGDVWDSVSVFIPKGAIEVHSSWFGSYRRYVQIYTADNKWWMMIRDENSVTCDAMVQMRVI